jgi:hypothetical protein
LRALDRRRIDKEAERIGSEAQEGVMDPVSTSCRHGKGRRSRMKRTMVLTLAVVLSAGFAVTAQARTEAPKSHESHRHHRGVVVTFTKWVTSLPYDPSTLAGVNMAGVVGGDVGPGIFDGTVVRDDATSRPGFWLAQALYGFQGSRHAFVAYNYIAENDTVTPHTARIHGSVLGGWMKGAHVSGRYTTRDVCPIPTPGNVFGTVCIQGTLHLGFGKRH